MRQHHARLLLSAGSEGARRGLPRRAVDVQPLYSSDPDDLALSDPSGASAAKDWAGWLPYAGIVCLGGDGCVGTGLAAPLPGRRRVFVASSPSFLPSSCPRLRHPILLNQPPLATYAPHTPPSPALRSTKAYYTCSAGGVASAAQVAPAGFSCAKGALLPEVAADTVTNKCFQTPNPAYLNGQVRERGWGEEPSSGQPQRPGERAGVHIRGVGGEDPTYMSMGSISSPGDAGQSRSVPPLQPPSPLVQGATAQTCPAGGCSGFGCLPAATPLPAPTVIPSPTCPATSAGAAAVAISLPPAASSSVSVSGCAVAVAVSGGGLSLAFFHPASFAPVSCSYCLTADLRSSGVLVRAGRRDVVEAAAGAQWRTPFAGPLDWKRVCVPDCRRRLVPAHLQPRPLRLLVRRQRDADADGDTERHGDAGFNGERNGDAGAHADADAGSHAQRLGISHCNAVPGHHADSGADADRLGDCLPVRHCEPDRHGNCNGDAIRDSEPDAVRDCDPSRNADPEPDCDAIGDADGLLLCHTHPGGVWLTDWQPGADDDSDADALADADGQRFPDDFAGRHAESDAEREPAELAERLWDGVVHADALARLHPLGVRHAGGHGLCIRHADAGHDALWHADGVGV